MSNLAPISSGDLAQRPRLVSIKGNVMVLQDPKTQKQTAIEIHPPEQQDIQDTTEFATDTNILENDGHPVISGTTENSELQTSQSAETHKDHALLKGVGLVAISAYATTSAVNAIALGKGFQGPVDTYEMLVQVLGFYKKFADAIGWIGRLT